MEPLIPSKATFLSKPKRPSRLFIVLFSISAVVNAVLLINFGFWESRLLIERQSWRNSLDSAEAQADTYKQERDLAQEDIAVKDARLAELDKTLSETSTKLKNTETALSSLNARVKAQESQLAKNSAELQALRDRPPLFKFESSSSRDVTTDKADAQTVVTAAYDVIKSIYGQPYILHQITIQFVDSLSIPGAVGEIEIENSAEGISITIKLTSFSKDDPDNVDTIIHEIIHGFHGIAALSAPVTEEGIAVAATDRVMSLLAANGIIPESTSYISLTDEQAAALNASLGPPPDDSSFYSLPKATVQQYYQLAGWSWRKLTEADSQFFTKFNEALYTQVAAGNSATPSLVRSLINQITPAVAGQNTASWLASQVIFNPI